MRTGVRIAAALLTLLLVTGGCAYFNTLYNAKAKYNEAQEQKKRADPERLRITAGEERLYTEAFEKAARVVKFYPDSKYVDDALLLMGKASFEKRDYSTALRKFDEILKFYPESKLTSEALLMKGRTQIQTKDYDAGVASLTRAAALDAKGFRDDITYFLGVVQYEQGNDEAALEAFSEVVSKYHKSEWFADAGILAGDIATERGDLGVAVAFYEKVRDRGKTMEDRYRGALHKGEALLALGEYERAKNTFRDASDRTIDVEHSGHARVMEGKAALSSGDVDGARSIFQAALEEYERKEAAADAQLALAKIHDDAGDLETALAEYELVKEQGTGHEAWQTASSRRAEIQRVLDLRQAIEDEADPDRERNRFLLAEQLLEKIGDVDGALAEYASLANDASGTEWGARALFAQAWVMENRLQEKQAADSVLFKLANYYSGTEVDAFARRKFGQPVWKVEILDPPPVKFIRPDASAEPQDVVLDRVAPRDVPLPPGVDQVKVWVRVTVAEDGSAASAKVAKSAGEGRQEFDDAALEAARASRFLEPNAGGPQFNVLEFTFPPAPAGGAAAAEGAAVPADPNASSPLPRVLPTSPEPAAADSTSAEERLRRFRDNRED